MRACFIATAQSQSGSSSEMGPREDTPMPRMLVDRDSSFEKRRAGSRSGANACFPISSAGGQWTWQCTSMQTCRRAPLGRSLLATARRCSRDR